LLSRQAATTRFSPIAGRVVIWKQGLKRWMELWAALSHGAGEALREGGLSRQKLGEKMMPLLSGKGQVYHDGNFIKHSETLATLDVTSPSLLRGTVLAVGAGQLVCAGADFSSTKAVPCTLGAQRHRALSPNWRRLCAPTTKRTVISAVAGEAAGGSRRRAPHQACWLRGVGM